MGKTKTAVISGKADEASSGKAEYDKKKQGKDDKATKVPGMGGGERITAVQGEALDSTDESATEKPTRRSKGQEGRGKSYQASKKQVDSTKLYKVSDAIKLVKDMSFTKFDGSVEMHLVVKKEGISESVTFPHSTGKDKVIEYADGSTIEKLKKGKIDFDILLATADMMSKLVPFAKLLGPRGMMPNPKNGTLVKDKKAADKFDTSKVLLKTEKGAPLIHTILGKAKQKQSELEANANAVLDAIGKRRIVKAYIAGSMTPSVKLDLSS